MNGEPEVRVEVAGVRALKAGRWRVEWRIAAREPLTFETVRLPHDHFFAAERSFSPELTLDRARPATLETEVACPDPPGAEVENAFLILRARRGVESWMVFVRVRIVVDRAGTPVPTIERVSAQRTTA